MIDADTADDEEADIEDRSVALASDRAAEDDPVVLGSLATLVLDLSKGEIGQDGDKEKLPFICEYKKDEFDGESLLVIYIDIDEL